jgi:hypothetical protein
MVDSIFHSYNLVYICKQAINTVHGQSGKKKLSFRISNITALIQRRRHSAQLKKTYQTSRAAI